MIRVIVAGLSTESVVVGIAVKNDLRVSGINMINVN